MWVAVILLPPTSLAMSYRSVVLVTTLSCARAVPARVSGAPSESAVPNATAVMARNEIMYVSWAPWAPRWSSRSDQNGCGLCGPSANDACSRMRLVAEPVAGEYHSYPATSLEDSLGKNSRYPEMALVLSPA